MCKRLMDERDADAGSGDFILSDLRGRMIRQAGFASSTRLWIDVSQLRGVFLMRLTIDSGVSVRKIFID